MSVKTIRKCDKCDKSWDTAKEPKRQLWRIGIIVESYPLGHRRAWPRQTVDWCRPCLDKNKLTAPKPEARDAAPETTIEDLIREIVEGYVADAQCD